MPLTLDVDSVAFAVVHLTVLEGLVVWQPDLTLLLVKATKMIAFSLLCSSQVILLRFCFQHSLFLAAHFSCLWPLVRLLFVVSASWHLLHCLQVAMKNADGQKKVCEAVMECLRLMCVYSGYIHAYAAMAGAPFSVLLVVSERHEAVSWKQNIACMHPYS